VIRPRSLTAAAVPLCAETGAASAPSDGTCFAAPRELSVDMRTLLLPTTWSSPRTRSSAHERIRGHQRARGLAHSRQGLGIASGVILPIVTMLLRCRDRRCRPGIGKRSLVARSCGRPPGGSTGLRTRQAPIHARSEHSSLGGSSSPGPSEATVRPVLFATLVQSRIQLVGVRQLRGIVRDGVLIERERAGQSRQCGA
jgi:hypothetical protein